MTPEQIATSQHLAADGNTTYIRWDEAVQNIAITDVE